MTERVAGNDLTSVRADDTQGPAPGRDRVRKHRDRLRAEGCSRLDLWVERRLFNDLFTLAVYRHVPLRQPRPADARTARQRSAGGRR